MNGAVLSWSSFNRANFSHAALQNAHFSHSAGDSADFSETQLMGADFRKARLRVANFSAAQLHGADLAEADLSAANFSSALLMGADFRNGRLPAANFQDAALQGARFSNSSLYAANFVRAHMQGAAMDRASLLAASFEQTFLHAATFVGADVKGASFESSALSDASFDCADFFRTEFRNSSRERTSATARTAKKCEIRGSYVDSIDYGYSYYALTGIANEYDLQIDALPKGHYYDVFYPDAVSYIYTHPEKLDVKIFERQLNDFVLSRLPDEESKKRVRKAFERLKPGARTKAQDDAEKASWAEWAKKSAPRERHDEALAARLEHIACVADGAPYAARGLLRAGRFDPLPAGEKMSDDEKARVKRVNEGNRAIVERLKKASKSGDASCPGAIGLVDADFLKPTP